MARQPTIEQTLAQPHQPTPRLGVLYRDASKTFTNRHPVPDMDLWALLMVIARESNEVSPEDDAQLRAAYRIEAKA